MQFQMVPFNFGVDLGTGLRHVWAWNETVFDHWFDAGKPAEQGFTILPTLLRPKSRGSLTLSGPSIHDEPVIDANFLDHEDDLKSMVEAIKFLKSLEATETFKKYEAGLIPEKILCGNKHELWSDAYYECFIKEYLSTIYHPVSTCAMGPKNHKVMTVYLYV